MHKAILFISFLGLFFSCKSQNRPPVQTSLASFIQHKGDSLLKTENVPGILVGVFDGDTRFYSFGYADPDKKIPFDSTAIFEAGSITKTFTAYIVESILKQKNISDSSSIFPYLPDSVQRNKALSSITFLSLLNHTSGLPRIPDNLPLTSTAPYDNYRLDDLFSFLKQCNPKPDGKSNYSNLGMGLVGVLAERIAGTDFKTLLKTHVFHPYEMNDALQARPKKAQGYFENTKQPFWNMNALFPAGGVQCSARDMLAYLQAMSLLSAGGSYQSQIIGKLLQPTVKLTPAMNVCRAWHTLEQNGKPTIYWHNGGTYGFSTFAAFVKETERSVIVVVNQFNKNNISDGLGIAIMKKMLNEK